MFLSIFYTIISSTEEARNSVIKSYRAASVQSRKYKSNLCSCHITSLSHYHLIFFKYLMPWIAWSFEHKATKREIVFNIHISQNTNNNNAFSL